MTTSISSPPLSDGGALHPLLWNETGLDGAACARPDLSHDWLRVAAGVYALRSAWQEAPWMERYELLLEAAHRKYGEDLVLAGASAVAAYGLPLVGGGPAQGGGRGWASRAGADLLAEAPRPAPRH